MATNLELENAENLIKKINEIKQPRVIPSNIDLKGALEKLSPEEAAQVLIKLAPDISPAGNIPEQHKKNRKFVLEIVEKRGLNELYDIADMGILDELFLLKLAKVSGGLLNTLKEDETETLQEFLENRDIVEAAIETDGLDVKYAPKKFRADKEIMLKAITQNPRAKEYLAENLENDQEILSAIKSSEAREKLENETHKFEKELPRKIDFIRGGYILHAAEPAKTPLSLSHINQDLKVLKDFEVKCLERGIAPSEKLTQTINMVESAQREKMHLIQTWKTKLAAVETRASHYQQQMPTLGTLKQDMKELKDLKDELKKYSSFPEQKAELEELGKKIDNLNKTLPSVAAVNIKTFLQGLGGIFKALGAAIKDHILPSPIRAVHEATFKQENRRSLPPLPLNKKTEPFSVNTNIENKNNNFSNKN
jgi:hypothetical protein